MIDNELMKLLLCIIGACGHFRPVQASYLLWTFIGDY